MQAAGLFDQMKASLTNWKATSAGYEKQPDTADIGKVEEVMQVFTYQATNSGHPVIIVDDKIFFLNFICSI